MTLDLQKQAKLLLEALKEKQCVMDMTFARNQDHQKIKIISTVKSVSFGENLQSLRRRARSASPTIHTRHNLLKPKKSILKKQNLNEPDNKQERIIESITKSRQKYLSHVYEGDDEIDLRKAEFDGLNLSKKHWNYLIDDGNERTKATNCIDNEEISMTRSKSDNQLNKLNAHEVKSKKSVSLVNSKNKRILKNKPLLGYDWIKDMLDNKKHLKSIDKSDDYWNELINFRNKNKDECISTICDNTTLSENDSRLLIEDTDSFYHKCIHSYTLNERLFPVPNYTGADGQSICPVCKSSRKEPSNYAPQFCKISIPQSRLVNQPLILPQKRSQYDTRDTLALADHCVSGAEIQQPHTTHSRGRNKNLDLKSAAGVPNDYIKFTMDDLKNIASNKDPNAGIYNKGHAMRYELEDQHQKRLKELIPKMNAF